MYVVKKNYWENNGYCLVGYVCCMFLCKSGGDFEEKIYRVLLNCMLLMNVLGVICDKY